MSARLARIALALPPAPTVNRLTGDDLVCISAYIAEQLERLERPASIAEDFARLLRGAPRSIGYQQIQLRQSELDEIADMVCAAILDHEAVTS